MGNNREPGDISELREALSTIIAGYTYLSDPFAIVREADIMLQFITTMLDMENKLDLKTRDGKTYRQLLRDFRRRWSRALDKYNQITGDWKDAWVDCSEIIENLMRIAGKEGLISLKPELFNISNAGVGGIGTFMQAGEHGANQNPGGSARDGEGEM